MVNFGDVGVICVNREREEVCQNCLWWQWDSGTGLCGNCQSPICALYRQQLFFAGRASRLRPEPRPSTRLRSSGAGLAGPPAAKAGESGNV